MSTGIGAGTAVGVGIAIGIIGVALVGGGLGVTAYEYFKVQQANDPVYVNTQTELQYRTLLDQINKNRSDDMDRYCKGAYITARDIYSEAANKFEISLHEFKRELDSAAHDMGKCAVQFGWDDPYAPDASQQYKKIVRAQIKKWWVGDRQWLENKFAEEDRRS